MTKIKLTDNLSLSQIIRGFWRLDTWELSTDELIDNMKSSIDLGVTSFDTAEIYADTLCESQIGEAFAKDPALRGKVELISKTGIEISYIPRDLITVIFYYQISLNPLKTQSLSQVSFPLLFPLRYIVPPVFTNSDKGKNKGKKII